MAIQVFTYTKGISLCSPVYLDANFLIACRIKNHLKYQSARDLLLDLFALGIEIFISSLTIDEVWWGLLGEWYYADTGRTLSGRLLKQQPAILSQYALRLSVVTNQYMAWDNTTILPNSMIDSRDTVKQALSYLTRHHLSPRDAFHLALAKLSQAKGFVTSDTDFDALYIRGMHLTIYKY